MNEIEKHDAALYRREYARRARIAERLADMETEWSRRTGRARHLAIFGVTPLTLARQYAIMDADLREAEPCLLDDMAAKYGVAWARRQERNAQESMRRAMERAKAKERKEAKK